MADVEGGKMNVKNIIITLLISLGVIALMSVMLFRMGGQEQDTNVVYEGVAGDERHVKGDGAVVMVEFSDFQCPACKSAEGPVQEILSRYEGQVKFVYRHLPLNTIHPNAQMAAQASEAAHMQGKFYEYHDLLFETQIEWSQESDPRELFVGYAGRLGLDIDKFRSDMESEEAEDIVNKDSLDASRLGLSSTPSFFLNGERVDLSGLELKIQENLNSGE